MQAIGWPRLISLMTTGPSKLLGLDTMGLGTLRIGASADVTVIDPTEKWSVDLATSVSKSRNSPFHGRQLVGRAVHVYAGGMHHRVNLGALAV